MKPYSLLLITFVVLAACSKPPAPSDDVARPATAPSSTSPSSTSPSSASPAPTAPPAATPPAVPESSIPLRFQGRWAASGEACGKAGHESELALNAQSVQFHESTGPVTQATVEDDQLTLVARLTGEGETRDATYRFTLSDGDSVLTDADHGLVRRRCP